MAPPAYRVIYNWDGAPHGDGAPPQSMERFLEATFAPLKGTHVDALFFSCGGHTAQYPSEVLPLVRDRSGRLYESVGAMIGGENVLQMIERGEDYQAAMIERGHELGIDVFASFRVNDNHFDGALTPQDAAAQDDMTPMRLEHPEWTLGTETAPWFATSWNMSVPEVREHIYEAVVELCERADWDGLEMDWQRHAFHLPSAPPPPPPSLSTTGPIPQRRAPRCPLPAVAQSGLISSPRLPTPPSERAPEVLRAGMAGRTRPTRCARTSPTCSAPSASPPSASQRSAAAPSSSPSASPPPSRPAPTPGMMSSSGWTRASATSSSPEVRHSHRSLRHPLLGFCRHYS